MRNDLIDIGMRPHCAFVRARNVVSRKVAGETLVVPICGEVGDLASIYSFNAVGSLIWDLLETPKQLTELADAVGQAYDVHMERAEQDVCAFVKEMLQVGLAELAGEAFSPTERPVGRAELKAVGTL